MVKNRVLNKEYYSGPYCVCCGKKITNIWKNLLKAKTIKMPGTIGQSRKEWKGHKLYKDSDSFYDDNKLRYCPSCGKELLEDDIRTTWESRGECHGFPCHEEIITGFHCHNCGYEEEM